MFRKYNFFFFLTLIAFNSLFLSNLKAENAGSDKPNDIVICSQNLNNFAQQKGLGKTSFGKKRKAKNIDKQLANLVDRFEKKSCDVIALQEITGKNEKIAKERMRLITNKLKERTDKSFEILIGESLDRRIRNGYLVNSDVFKVKKTSTMKNDVLPKFNPASPLASYSRGPYVVYLEQITGKKQNLILINIHFKSKASSYRDPSKTKYELLRVQMAEGLKRTVLSSLAPENPKTPIFILGDLNSESTDAASAVLAGQLSLSDFSSKNCVITDEEEAFCAKKVVAEAAFLPLLKLKREKSGNIKEYSSYRYSSKYLLIDEILLLKEFGYLVSGKDGIFNAGLEGGFSKGSDHKLLWVKLRG